MAFEIYKKGQGKFVRMGTVLAAGLILGLGINWVLNGVIPLEPIYIKAPVALVILALGALAIYTGVNKPRYADFMIATESEMRKVIWPSRAEVISSTRIIVLMTLLLAVMLFLVDTGFLKFFQAINIIHIAK